MHNSVVSGRCWILVISLLCALHATAAKYNNEIHTFKMVIAGGIEGRKRKLDFEKVAGEIFRCCISFEITTYEETLLRYETKT